LHGVTVFYLPKTNVALDFFYGEDILMKFETKFEMTVYVESTGSWGGAGDLFAKMGMEVRDEATFKIQMDQFATYTGMERPMIGDLLYLPWQKDKELMEITHVDMEAPFYHLGNVSVFTIKAARMKYTRQSIPALDDTDELGEELIDILTDENIQPNDTTNIKDEVTDEDIIDSSESNPFGG
jgi:hypothetical protein